MSAEVPSWRSAKEYACLHCDKRFHPLRAGSRKYCSVKCSGAANSERQQRARTAREAAKSGSMSPEQLVAFLNEQPSEPRLWVELPDDESSS